MKQFGAISHPSARCSESSLNLTEHKRSKYQQVRERQRGGGGRERERERCRHRHAAGCVAARGRAALTFRDYPTETVRSCCAWWGPRQHGAATISHPPASSQWQGAADCHLNQPHKAHFVSNITTMKRRGNEANIAAESQAHVPLLFGSITLQCASRTRLMFV
jgi:hypothetical protein